MDETDKKLLNLVQKGLPVCDYPFHELAKELGISPGEVIERLERLKNMKIIRRIGAVFDAVRMGYTSCLFAMEVPEERFQAVAEAVNSFSGVTHNYKRSGALNMWFTLSSKSEEDKAAAVRSISEMTGIRKILEFPAVNRFKLNVFFDMENGNENDG
jgi:DNA-binding Lrp family transcriptional regulator